jgi:release factor glutamine methyltransferase
LELEVDSRVLIPRPETEGLVEHVLAWLSRHPAARVVADIGTGSGCIALALAVEGRFARVIATDVSPAALAVARRNVARVSPPVPIEVREGSGCEALRGVEVDVIVSNPPYVSAAEFEELEPSVRLFEPREALVSGDGGLAHSRLSACWPWRSIAVAPRTPARSPPTVDGAACVSNMIYLDASGIF